MLTNSKGFLFTPKLIQAYQMQKVLTKTIIVLSMVSLFNDIASELLYPVMPVYLKSIGFGMVAIGVLEGIAEAFAGLTKGYFGSYSDRLGKRLPFIQMGYGLTALARLMLVFFTNISGVFTARLTDRLGKGIRTAARDAMLHAEALPQHKAKVFGFHRSMDTCGAVIGPLIALLYLHYNPGAYFELIKWAVLPCVFAVAFTFLIKENTFEKKSVKFGWASAFTYWKTATPSFKSMCIKLWLFALCNSADVFLLLYLKLHGFTDTQMIGSYLLYNIVYAATAFPIGILADKIGLKPILITGLLLFATVYAGITLTSNPLILVAMMVTYGLYAACFDASSKAYLSLHIQKTEAGSAFGLFGTVNSLAILFASVWAGFMWQNGYHAATMIISALMATSVAVAIYLSQLKTKIG